MATNPTIDRVREILNDVASKIKEGDKAEVYIRKGVREKTAPGDAWYSYENNGTLTLVLRINGGARDETDLQ